MTDMQSVESVFGHCDVNPIVICNDETEKAEEEVEKLGILSPPAANKATVVVIRGDFQKVCRSRVLALHSGYFRRHLINYPSPRVVAVPECVPICGLKDALDWIETGRTEVSTSKLGPLLCAAARLEIWTLQHRLEHYLRCLAKTHPVNFLACWEMCRCVPASVQLRNEMCQVAADNLHLLYVQPTWPSVSHRMVQKVLLCAQMDPVTVFEVVLTWIGGNPSADAAAVDRLVSAVPFKKMTPISRMQCLDKAQQMGLTKMVLPHVALADWHQTCLEHGHPSATDLPVSEKQGVSKMENNTGCMKHKRHRCSDDTKGISSQSTDVSEKAKREKSPASSIAPMKAGYASKDISTDDTNLDINTEIFDTSYKPKPPFQQQEEEETGAFCSSFETSNFTTSGESRGLKMRKGLSEVGVENESKEKKPGALELKTVTSVTKLRPDGRVCKMVDEIVYKSF